MLVTTTIGGTEMSAAVEPREIIAPTRITLIPAPTTVGDVKANRAAFTAVLRDPNTAQIRGPWIAYAEPTGDKIGGCLLGTMVLATQGYYLSPNPSPPQDTEGPEAFGDGYYHPNGRPIPQLNHTAGQIIFPHQNAAYHRVLGIPASHLTNMVARNDNGLSTFAELADEIDHADITLYRDAETEEEHWSAHSHDLVPVSTTPA